MIYFTIQKKTKEISIRKVLGASVGQIVAIFSKDSIKLILLASIISVPLTWYFLEQWLTNFAYRTEISLLVLVESIGVVFFIALGTVGIRVVKAAMKNPANNLRTE